MNAALPLIRKLQAEAANPDASVTNLLRMAKIAATKLNLKDALVWIDSESYVWLGAEFFESNMRTENAALQEVAFPLWRTRPAQGGGSLFLAQDISAAGLQNTG